MTHGLMNHEYVSATLPWVIKGADFCDLPQLYEFDCTLHPESSTLRLLCESAFFISVGRSTIRDWTTFYITRCIR